MFLPRLRHVVLTVIPALIALVVMGFALFGHKGLFKRHELRKRLADTQADLVRMELENLALRREIRLLRERPQAVQRAAAEELLMAPRGSTIYRFDARTPESGDELRIVGGR